MKFGPDTLGLLVRPRILVAAKVLPLNSWNSLVPTASFSSLKQTYRGSSPDPTNLFGESLIDLFLDLKLGNTLIDETTAYTAQVVSYIAKVGSEFLVVNKSNLQETLVKIRNRFGPRTNLKIVSVGVKFFCGIKINDGVIEAINPWTHLTKSGQETIWFYKPWELVPMVEILKYEKIMQGELVLFQKCHGLVIKKKLLNKPKFFLTNSWTCFSITLLNHTGDGFTRFLPDRRFSVHSKEN